MDLLLMSGSKKYQAKMMALFGAAVLGYWPMQESSGTAAVDVSGNGRHGVYTGVELANAAAPAGIGGKAPYFDGANDTCNVFSAGLAAAFPKTEGSYLLFGKAYNAGVWGDATTRRLTAVADTGGNDRIGIVSNGNNTTNLFYQANGTTESVVIPAVFAPTDWTQFAITWSLSGDAMKAYVNGVQTGVTQTGLATYTDAPSIFLIGASTLGPAQVWNGWICHALLLNRPASDAELLQAYRMGV